MSRRKQGNPRHFKCDSGKGIPSEVSELKEDQDYLLQGASNKHSEEDDFGPLVIDDAHSSKGSQETSQETAPKATPKKTLMNHSKKSKYTEMRTVDSVNERHDETEETSKDTNEKTEDEDLDPSYVTPVKDEMNNNLLDLNNKMDSAIFSTPKNMCNHDFTAPLTVTTEGSHDLMTTPSRHQHPGGAHSMMMLHSPAPSTGSVQSSRSNTSESSSRSKLSQPSKARRKNDKILPVPDLCGERYVCPICKVCVDSQPSLTKHIRSHNQHDSHSSGNNECTICGKVLSSQSSLDRHMLVHSGERPFSCKVCNMSFTTNGNMHRHSRIHAKDGSGSPSLKDAPSRGSSGKKSDDQMSIGSSSSSRKRALEINAASMTTTKRRLYDDEAGHIRYPIQQPPGPMMPGAMFGAQPFPTIGWPMDVPMDVPKEANVPKKPEPVIPREYHLLHSCPLCTKKFEKEEELNLHLTIQHRQLPTSQPPPKQELKQELKPVKKDPQTCAICQLTYRTEAALSTHFTAHHSGNVKDAVVYDEQSHKIHGFDELSFTEFSNEKFGLIASQWCSKSAVVSVSDSIFKQSFSCTQCYLKFPCDKALYIHSKSHIYPTGINCTECECEFEDENSYAFHTMTKHIPHTILDSLKRPADFSDNSDSDSDSESDVPTLNKEGFMIMCGLKKKSEAKLLPTRSEPKLSSTEPIAKQTLLMQQETMLKMMQQKAAISKMSLMAMDPKPDSLSEPIQAGSSASLFSRYDNRMRVPFRNLIGPAQMLLNKPGYLEALNFGKPSQEGAPPPNRRSSSPTSTSGMRLPHVLDESEHAISEQVPYYCCKLCLETFPNKTFYTDHLHKIHNGCTFESVASDCSAMFKCTLCSFLSTSKRHIVTHLRSHCTQPKPFQCRICENAFLSRDMCETHIREHELAEVYTEEEVQSSVGYNAALLEAAPNQMIPFHEVTCKYCRKCFNSQERLVGHLLSPGGCLKRPYLCMLCNNGFTNKNNCKRHIHKQHPDVPIKFITICIYGTDAGEVHDNTVEDVGRISAGHQPHSFTFPHKYQAPAGISGLRAASCYITSPPIVKVKQEAMEDDDQDQPLDFSTKSSGGKSTNQKSKKDEQRPIDLSGPSSSQLPFQVPGFAVPGMIHPAALLGQQSLAHLSGGHLSTGAMNLAGQAQNNALSQRLMLRQRLIETSRLNHSIALQKEQELLNNASNNATLGTTSGSKSILPQMRCISTHNGTLYQCIMCAQTFKQPAFLEQHFKTYHGSIISHSKQMTRQNAAQSQNQQLNSDVTPKNNSKENEQENRDLNNNEEHKPSLMQRGVKKTVADLSSIHSMLNITDSAKFKTYLSINDGMKPRLPSTMPALPTLSDKPMPIVVIKKPVPKPVITVETKPSSSRDIDEQPVKRKRNSYAESPHKLSCPYCPRAFPWISSLNRHLLTHTGQKPFKCPKCPVMFSTKSNRERHLIRKHGLNVHDPATRQMMDRPFKCHLCVFSSFATAGNLMRHYLDKHPQAELPEHVKQEYNMETMNQNKHEELIAAAAKVNGTDPSMTDYQRDTEDDDLTEEDGTEENSLRHNFRKLLEQKTRDLSQISSNGAGSLQVASSSPDRLSTPTPPPALISASNLVKDMPTATSVILQHTAPALALNSATTSVRVCTPSGNLITIRAPTPTSNLSARNTPTPTSHTSSPDVNPERDNYNVDRITDCWKCGEDLHHRKDLLRHLKEHNIDLAYKCYLCDASFEQRHESLIHVTQKHLGEWEILRAKNNIEDPLEFCTLMNRIVEHNFLNIKGKMWNTRAHDLRKLGLTDDFMPESDYVQRKVYCTLCPKRFWSLQDLRRHMRSHTGERPFECSICQKRFTLKHSMMRHKRKHTNAELLAYTTNPGGSTVTPEGTTDGSEDEMAPVLSLDDASNCSDNTSNGRNTPAWETMRGMSLEKISEAAMAKMSVAAKASNNQRPQTKNVYPENLVNIANLAQIMSRVTSMPGMPRSATPVSHIVSIPAGNPIIASSLKTATQVVTPGLIQAKQLKTPGLIQAGKITTGTPVLTTPVLIQASQVPASVLTQTAQSSVPGLVPAGSVIVNSSGRTRLISTPSRNRTVTTAGMTAAGIDQPDILHSLLGFEDAKIDQMVEAAMTQGV